MDIVDGCLAVRAKRSVLIYTRQFHSIVTFFFFIFFLIKLNRWYLLLWAQSWWSDGQSLVVGGLGGFWKIRTNESMHAQMMNSWCDGIGRGASMERRPVVVASRATSKTSDNDHDKQLFFFIRLIEFTELSKLAGNEQTIWFWRKIHRISPRWWRHSELINDFLLYFFFCCLALTSSS